MYYIYWLPQPNKWGAWTPLLAVSGCVPGAKLVEGHKNILDGALNSSQGVRGFSEFIFQDFPRLSKTEIIIFQDQKTLITKFIIYQNHGRSQKFRKGGAAFFDFLLIFSGEQHRANYFGLFRTKMAPQAKFFMKNSAKNG